MDPIAPDDVDEEPELAREEHRALGWAAAGAVAVIVWLVMPIGVGILLGSFLAFMMQPIFERLCARIGARWAAAVTVAGSTLALASLVAGAAWLFVARGAELANRLIASFGAGGTAEGILADVSKLTARFGISHDDLVARARGFASDLAMRAGGAAQTLATTVGSALLALLFAMLAMH